MCGIVGMAGNGLTTVDLKVFTDLMTISALRGTDGTGIFQGHFDKFKNTWLIEKRAWPVNSFFRLHKSKAGNKLLLNSCLDNVFIGHTRWATAGELTDENCHPYHVDNIVGVHNGTMEDTKYWNIKETDSLLLYKDIQARGLKTVLEEVEHESAFALSYIDMQQRKLYFARNIERPLYVMHHLNRKAMYWASEGGFLELAAKRHKLDVSEPKVFCVNKIYSIDIDDIGPDKDTGFKIEDFKRRPSTKTKITTTYAHGWEGIEWGRVMGGDNLNDPIPFDRSFHENRSRMTKAERKAQRAERKEQQRLTRLTMLQKNSHQAKNGVSLAPAMIKTPSVLCPKIPMFKCLSCDTNLKLIDQFFADRIFIESTGDLIFECKKCKKLDEELASIDNKETEVTVN